MKRKILKIKRKGKTNLEKILSLVFSVFGNQFFLSIISIFFGLLMIFFLRSSKKVEFFQVFLLPIFGSLGILSLAFFLVFFGARFFSPKNSRNLKILNLLSAVFFFFLFLSSFEDPKNFEIFDFKTKGFDSTGVFGFVIINFLNVVFGSSFWTKIVLSIFMIFFGVKFLSYFSTQIKAFLSEAKNVLKDATLSVKPISKTTKKVVEKVSEIAPEFIATEIRENQEENKKRKNFNENIASDDLESENFEKKSSPDYLTYLNQNWEFPTPDGILANENPENKPDGGDKIANARKIEETLKNFGIESQVLRDQISVGPAVTQYPLKPDEKVKLSKITGLSSNLALSLSAKSIRIEAPIPGKPLVGIEVPNIKRSVVSLKSLLSEKPEKGELKLPLGRNIYGEASWIDLAKMPHLLVAGATGTGKSVCLNSILVSLLMERSPKTLRLVLVDPKKVEFAPYADIPHLITPVITDPQKTLSALKWLVSEMNRRYDKLSEIGKRNIADFNKAVSENEKMPYIVLIIDELADLMLLVGKEVEHLIVRLAQMARAIGIHLILATQRPSVNVVTGLIKANIPARVVFAVSSQVDSRTVIDLGGAEKLLGRGDMLHISPDSSRLTRIQGTFVTDDEVEKITTHWKKQSVAIYQNEVLESSSPENFDEFSGNENFEKNDDFDSLFSEAKNIVISARSASTSLLQRRLKIGYARAARIMDQLEEKGIISPSDGTSKARDVLI